MPVRAPATRDQADAYRFGLRRLEAALVRGDPVPLHEQIRSQRRASVAGVALGLLGVCAAALFAALAPAPDWRNQAIIEESGSDALYVVADNPARLIPVDNLAAARLVLAAVGRQGSPNPVEVPQATLAQAPRTAPVGTAVPGALRVSPELGIAASWALCDASTPEGTSTETTVIGGAVLPPPSAPADGVLLAGPDETTYLVTEGRRYRVDVGDGALLAAFGLTRGLPRQASAGLLELLPEGPELSTPVVSGRGRRAPDGLPGQVGDVLVARPIGGGPEYYVILADGLQPVPAVLAELLRVASGERSAREVGGEVLAVADFTDDLTVAGWPTTAPRVQAPATAPVVCWTWTPGGPAGGSVWVGAQLPMPPGAGPVALAEADGPGPGVDAVAVGRGGAVRAVDAGATGPVPPAGAPVPGGEPRAGGLDRAAEQRGDGADGNAPDGSDTPGNGAANNNGSGGNGSNDSGSGGSSGSGSGGSGSGSGSGSSGSGSGSSGSSSGGGSSGSGSSGSGSGAAGDDGSGASDGTSGNGSSNRDDEPTPRSGPDSGTATGVAYTVPLATPDDTEDPEATAPRSGTGRTGTGDTGGSSGGSSSDSSGSDSGGGSSSGTGGPGGDTSGEDTGGAGADGADRGDDEAGGSRGAGAGEAGSGDPDPDRGRTGGTGPTTADVDPTIVPVPDGRIWLISETGLAHPVADQATATALGITAPQDAPAALLALLPAGAALDLPATSAVVISLR